MEIKSISFLLIFVAIMTILMPSIVGVGEMADNKDDKKESGWISKLLKNNDWGKKFLEIFNYKKITGFMNSEKSNGDYSKDKNSRNFQSEDFDSNDFDSEDVFSPSHICGNGKIDTDPQSTETCDDGNTRSGDGCDSECHLEFCGDNKIQSGLGEQCEPPNTATCDAFCKFRPDNKFEHAFIDLKLEKVLVDPNGQPESGDEYFDNLITECSFHSDDSMEGKVCLKCLIVDKKIEPCVDASLDFTNLEDGTLQEGIGGINEALAPFGITVKGIAKLSSMPDDLQIWDADVNHVSLTGPANEDNDIESPPNGYCADCAGLHILIFPDDEDNNGIGDPGDDSATGGTIVFTFKEPKRVWSFDIVDIENDGNAVAIAYGKSISETECDTSTKIKEVKIPLVNDGESETVIVDANNVMCFTIKYHDSGGVTNFDFQCPRKLDESGILSEGELELPNGYQASTKLSIPLELGVDVQKAVGVKIDARCPVPPQGLLTILKFYDKNLNGVIDPGEQLLTGWKVTTVDSSNVIVLSHTGFTTIAAVIPTGTYTTTESTSTVGNWIATTPMSVTKTIPDNAVETIEFGNVCTGGGGGKTPGFWTNKNGEELIKDSGGAGPELALLSSLNLRDSAGNHFDPTTYSALKTWLQNRNAVNMAYMLSAHFAAMTLNVEAGLVSTSAQVYAPGIVPGDNFLSISELLSIANTKLGEDGFTPSGDPNRALQEAIKNALDDANNNKNFVKSSPCEFGFS